MTTRKTREGSTEAQDFDPAPADRGATHDEAKNADAELSTAHAGLVITNDELRRRLEEAEETIRAIQSGAVDAVVVQEPAGGHQIYTLDGADRPYRLMVEQMQQGAATLHEDGTIAYCNLRVAEMLHMPHERLISAVLRDFVDPGDLGTYDDLLKRSLHETVRGEALLRRADGDLVSTYLTFNPLPKDCRADIGVLITDLTAQRHHEQLKAAHEALRKSEERFQQIAQGVDAGFYVTDVGEQRFHYISPGFERLWGLSASQLERDRRSWLDRIHHEDLTRVTEAYEAFVSGGPIYYIEYRIVLPSGERRWVRDRATIAAHGLGGRAQLITGIIDDITIQRQTEERLWEADHRKDEFLATLAHELRGPLAPLSNLLAIMETTDNDAELMRRTREVMERQLHQLVRLVDDLLDVNRISRGKIELKRVPVELAVVIDQAVEASTPLAEKGHHEVRIALPPDPVYFYADPVRLTQIFSNLLNNACKYTESGGVIFVTAEREHREVVVKVKDTGVGIPADKLATIFEMFVQVDQSLERSQGGLGIGLTLVRRLVEMHGGTVAAFSDGPDHGSEFVVRLPILVRDPDWRSSDGAELAATVGQRILIVDDNVDSAQSLAMLLSIKGNQTYVAHDGEEAVAAAERLRPDVVLLDIGLPKLNGYDACRRIREYPWGKKMMLVALTGLGQASDRERSKEARFDHHLVKPVDVGVLLQLLNTA